MTSRACGLIALVAVAMPLAAAAIESRTIGVYFDEAGTICKGTIEPGVPTSLYIVVKFGDLGVGAAGCEFRFRGGPDSWRTFPVANPGILAIGNPLGDGVTAGFAACVGFNEPAYVVYSVLVLADQPAEDVIYELQGRIPPSNPNFPCPLVLDCNTQFLAHCVTNIKCRVNSNRPSACAQVTAVEPSSWTVVKGLYWAR